MRSSVAAFLLCASCASCAMGPAAAHACSAQQVEADFGVLTSALDERARGALARIAPPGHRLLAARSYLRAGALLAQRWSWTAEEIAAYERSQEYRTLRGEIAKVTERFESQNPGYTLYVNLSARSVDLQLERWSSNASVARAAAQILEAAVEAHCRPQADVAKLPGPARLRQFLVDWRPPVLPTLAAPGLSRHGRLRAFDFQVKRGDRVVAGPDSSTIATVWTAQGWTTRVRTAVRAATTKLDGPLEHPNEPWHYVYEP
jgi:hypothetical protein